MIRKLVYFAAIILFWSCNCSEEKTTKKEENIAVEIPVLNLQEANRLAQLPIRCIKNRIS